MIILLIVFVSVFATLNIFMWTTSRVQTDRLLEMIIELDGLPRQSGRRRFMESLTDQAGRPAFNMMRAGRFFYVKFGESGAIEEIRRDMMFDFTDDDAIEYAQTALSRRASKGTLDSSFRYAVADKDYGTIVVFAERSIETLMLERLNQVSLWVAGATSVLLLIVTYVISNWAVSPVKDAFEKQRRFISDAGHELKTPLAILGANIDLLGGGRGENVFAENIRTQADRMRHLINDLLTLAMADECVGMAALCKFDLSQTVMRAALEFESRAFENGKNYEINIKESIYYTGDPERIKQLASILIDNAITHSEANGKIAVSLGMNDNDRPVLSVYNTGRGIAESERGKVFERFYRSDASRSRETGNFGLGLAIAKTIADAHKGAIAVDGQEGEWIRFTVKL